MAEYCEIRGRFSHPEAAVRARLVTAYWMPLEACLDLLSGAEWELSCRAGIFNAGGEVS